MKLIRILKLLIIYNQIFDEISYAVNFNFYKMSARHLTQKEIDEILDGMSYINSIILILQQIIVDPDEIKNLRIKLLKNMEGTIHINKSPCSIRKY